jgi:photosystem II stability/assembly factor-like uncharacterized protein
MPGNRQTDIFHTIKTRQLVIKNNDGSYPSENSVVAFTNERGNNLPSLNLSLEAIHVGDVSAQTITAGSLSAGILNAEYLFADVLSATLVRATTIEVSDLSATTINVGDLSANVIVTDILAVPNGDFSTLNISTMTVFGDLSATQIHVTDLSATNVTVLGDLSASSIHTVDLSATNAMTVVDLSATNMMILGDLSATQIRVTDLSATNVTVLGDLSASSIYTVDLSATNDVSAIQIYVTDLSATNMTVLGDLSATQIRVTDLSTTNIMFLQNLPATRIRVTDLSATTVHDVSGLTANSIYVADISATNMRVLGDLSATQISVVDLSATTIQLSASLICPSPNRIGQLLNISSTADISGYIFATNNIIHNYNSLLQYLNKIKLITVPPSTTPTTTILAASQGGQLFSSNDRGSTWTPVSGVTGFTFSFVTKIVWGGNIWVASGLPVSSYPPLLWSNDGINWYAPLNSISGTQTSDVNWNGSLFIAPYPGGIFSSIDGKNWVDVPILPSLVPAGIVWNGSLWMLLGAQHIYTSPDGAIWTERTDPLIQDMSPILNAVYDGTKWVVCGQVLTSCVIIYTTSTNPTWSWATATINISNFFARDIAWNGTVFVCVGTTPTTTCAIIYSYDGITWTGIPTASTGVRIDVGSTISWIIDRFVITGYNVSPIPGASIYSFDGIVWYQGTGIDAANDPKLSRNYSTPGEGWVEALNYPSGPAILDVIYGNGTFIYRVISKIYYSLDNGSTWTQNSFSPPASISNIFFTSGFFFAVGRQVGDPIFRSSVYRSSDGITFTLMFTSDSNSEIFNILSDGGANIVAVGYISSGSQYWRIWYSDDYGANWSLATLPAVFNEASNLSYGNGIFVAGGNSSQNMPLLYSTDKGHTWSLTSLIPAAQSNAVRNILFHIPTNTFFVTYFNNVTNISYIYSSSDGLNWINKYETNQGLIRILISGAANIIAVINPATIIVSQNNGDTWTNVLGNPFFGGGCTSVTYDSSLSTLYATGSDIGRSNIWKSTDDGITWTVSSKYAFGHGDGSAITTNNSGKIIAVGGTPALGDIWHTT